MIDIVRALQNKRDVLNGQKREIQQEAKCRIAEIDAQLAAIDSAQKTIDSIVKDHLCDRCHGEGTVSSYDAAGQREERPCPCCKGTGVKTDAEENPKERLYSKEQLLDRAINTKEYFDIRSMLFRLPGDAHTRGDILKYARGTDLYLPFVDILDSLQENH